jgi:hypothetical protein
MKKQLIGLSGLGLLLLCMPSVLAGQPSAQIVEPVARWTVSDVPTMRVGGEPSGPTSDVFSVRGVVELQNGRLVIADGGPRLIFLNPDGTHHRTVGRRGRGPGEFSQISWIARIRGDSIVVGEGLSAGRVSIFDSEGELGRILTVADPPIPTFYGVLDQSPPHSAG